jgi:alpha-1,2-mannosyltransferase
VTWQGLAVLREGNWLTARRVRVYSALILVGAVAGICVLLATSQGGLDPQGRPLGTDFTHLYGAGSLVRDGRPAEAYDHAALHAAQQGIFASEAVPYYGWHYPPTYLWVAGLFAGLPYLAALALWLALTLPLYLFAIRRIVAGRQAVLLALAYPAAFVNLIHGQNGFLTAGLAGLALVSLQRRPLLAGALFGLLAFKPQFGILIPFALAAGGQWRAFAAAAATVIATAAMARGLYGVEIWPVFLESATFTREQLIEQGAASFHRSVSSFAALRLFGAPLGLAYGVQAAAALAALAIVIWAWRGSGPQAIKSALLVACTLLATPYGWDYDLMLMALPIAWLAAAGLDRGFLPWEKTALLAVFALPFLARLLAGAVGLPIAPLVIAGFVLVLVRRLAAERAQS